jgi:hypothetical protein
VLALVHHDDDPYMSAETHTDNNSLQERKAAHKNLKVVHFTGTLPSAPAIMAVRINNPLLEQHLLTRLRVHLGKYPGLVRLFIPPLEIEGDLEEVVEGLSLAEEFDAFKEWVEAHWKMLEESQASDHPYNRIWTEQRMEDIELALASDVMLMAEDLGHVSIHQIVMEPDSHHTIFLMFDRPDAQIGETFDIEVLQEDVEREQMIGGMSARVELVPKPQIHKKYHLKLWTHQWLRRYTVVRAKLLGPAERPVSPDDGARMMLYEDTREGLRRLGWMRWHRAWRSFYTFSRGVKDRRFMAEGYIMSERVAVAKAAT